MNPLNQSDKAHLSFPDCKVQSMIFDLKNKKVEIHTDGCWIESYEGVSDKCIITISDWSDFEAISYKSSKDEFLKVDHDNLDPLADIPVFDFGDVIVLEGFGTKNFIWMIYKFYNAKLEGFYGEKETYD